MNQNLLTTTAARMAFFLRGSWAILAGETAKPEPVLYVLNAADREILAWDALGILSEQRDGMVSEQDVVHAAWLWATEDAEVEAFAADFVHVLSAE